MDNSFNHKGLSLGGRRPRKGSPGRRARGARPGGVEQTLAEVTEAPCIITPMERVSPDVSMFILAGGKSTRMGTDKAFVVLDGQTLLARALALARSITSEVRIVGAASKFAAFAPVVEDQFSDCGPLGGIHAALRISSTQLNLILAVDLPFASKEFLQYLLGCAGNSSAAVTLPHAGGRWQPLCAVYRRAFGDAAEGALRAERYKIDGLFDRVQVRAIGEEELAAAGFPTTMFHNLNTTQDLQQTSFLERRGTV